MNGSARCFYEYQGKDVTNYFAFENEGITIELEERIRVFQITAAQDRYDYILTHKPQIVQRVPLKYLASFLGITAETLSRIRRKGV
jgi:hypothetical protein